jgi:hypothetical protein
MHPKSSGSTFDLASDPLVRDVQKREVDARLMAEYDDEHYTSVAEFYNV